MATVVAPPAPRRSTTARSRRLGGRARKAVLTVHLLSGSGWIGIDIALGILVITAFNTSDAAVAATSLRALELFAVWPMFLMSVVCLLSGVVLGVGGKYGLVRYWWVAVKLAINVLMSVLVVTALRSGVGDAAEIGVRLAAGDDTALPTELLYPVVVAPSLLSIAVVLSVVKPWGLLRRAG